METIVASPQAQQSLLEFIVVFMNEGGVFMWVILVIWILGIGIILERTKLLHQYDINAPGFMATIKKYVLANDVQKAIQYCATTKALLPQVLRSGLKRANQSREQIQDALDSSILEVTPKVEKRLGYLGLLANVSTLFGLLGTIQGLIQSFSAVATADPSSKAKLLALGISVAMNTTALGLLSAISIMIVHGVLTSKAEKINNDIDEYSMKLLDLLGTKNRNMYVVESDHSQNNDHHGPTKSKKTQGGPPAAPDDFPPPVASNT